MPPQLRERSPERGCERGARESTYLLNLATFGEEVIAKSEKPWSLSQDSCCSASAARLIRQNERVVLDGFLLARRSDT